MRQKHGQLATGNWQLKGCGWGRILSWNRDANIVGPESTQQLPVERVQSGRFDRQSRH